MNRKESHTQQANIRIDLTRLKEYTDQDWQKIMHTVPFVYPYWRDFTDGCNVGRTNFVFKPRTFKTATESAMSCLRTLNFRL